MAKSIRLRGRFTGKNHAEDLPGRNQDDSQGPVADTHDWSAFKDCKFFLLMHGFDLSKICSALQLFTADGNSTPKFAVLVSSVGLNKVPKQVSGAIKNQPP